MKHKTIATLALVMTTTALTFATGTVTVPNTFTAGQAAKASEVNANFQALADAINAQDPFSAADAFAVTPVSGLVEGDTPTIGGRSLTMKALQAISFADGNNTRYKILTPAESSSAIGYPTIANQSDSLGLGGAPALKTTVSGYPAIISVLHNNVYSPYGNSAGSLCLLSVKLDAATYFSMPVDPDTVVATSPLSKARQGSALAACKTFFNYISVSTIP